ncbi:hypothetical protein BDV96DRAFT_482697 [Lophiotrema nucula]|uniref:Zn(2)-C6 fungal-type domain-containing protein n=1 Tax=Lophiotrema nucula TaxID=690887 RepID=A0A6A5ZRF7_9PLEO|nr:hypothetical protein BDV96DRAFT_482697 [Lophiotrema nucula]
MPSHSPEAALLARPAPLACLNCRRMHLKCDGKTPGCARCVSRGLSCSYTPSRRGLRRGTKQRTHGAEPISSQTSPYSFSEPSQRSPTNDSGFDRPTQAARSFDHPLLSTRQRSGQFSSWVDDEQLVNLYFLNFHASHPILLPRGLYWERAYSRSLKAVVEFIGSHFSPSSSSDILRKAVEREIEDGDQDTTEMVQARLLYAISLCARNEIQEGQQMLAQAIEIAIDLGMHRRDFAVLHAHNDPTEEESMRRTWYELYVTDGCIAAFQRKFGFKTNTVSADVLLPCDDSMYDNGMCTLTPASRDDFESSVFADDEIVFSSFCYRVEAVRLLGRVLTITGSHGVHRDKVQAVDNALAAFLHHLPASKSESEIVNTYGELDELMFQAHTIIQYATILLHFPRGDLASPGPFTTDVPGNNGVKFVCPCTRQHVHSIKAIDASKALSMLAAFRTPVQRHSPFVVYPLALAAIVQLSTSMIHSKGSNFCLEQHHDRITLILGVLKSLGRIWPIAEVVVRALKKVARSVFHPSRTENLDPIQQEDVVANGMDTSSNAMTSNLWLENLDVQDLHGLMGLDTDVFCL